MGHSWGEGVEACHGLCSLLQAFKHWVPSLREDDVNVVFGGSTRMTVDMLSAKVNIVSYDLAVRMASVLEECSYQVVIAVSEGVGCVE